MAKGITKLPSREAIRKHRQDRIENGFLFPLTATSVGLEEVIEVRVRRLSTVDRAAIEQLPQDMQTVVWEGLKEFQAEQRKMADMDEPDNMAEMLSNNEKILKAADAWCRAAFIYPRLVLTEKEITNEGIWLVEDVEAEDRVAILMASLDADSPQVKKLKMFRPQWGIHVEDGSAVPVAPEAESVVESSTNGLHAVPVS